MKKSKVIGTYSIDAGIIMQKAYSLLCIFFANKEIARRSDPQDENAPLSSLESRFFYSEASRLLLELAIAMRVIDDQIKKLPEDNSSRIKYYKIKNNVDKYPFGLFDDRDLNLRKTCNKIIHSETLEPHLSEGYEVHEYDVAYKYGDDKKSIIWEHLNGYVRLAGMEKGNEWYVLLDIEVFVKAVYKILENFTTPNSI